MARDLQKEQKIHSNTIALWKFSFSFQLNSSLNINFSASIKTSVHHSPHPPTAFSHAQFSLMTQSARKTLSTHLTSKSHLPHDRTTSWSFQQFQTFQWVPSRRSCALRLTPLWTRLCRSKALFQENASWHIPHVNGLLLNLWVRTCFANTSFREKPVLHNSHLYGFSPVCVLLCRARYSLREKHLLHTPQLNGFSPVWMRWWILRWYFLVNNLLHTSHSNRVSLWLFFCLLLCADFEELFKLPLTSPSCLTRQSSNSVDTKPSSCSLIDCCTLWHTTTFLQLLELGRRKQKLVSSSRQDRHDGRFYITKNLDGVKYGQLLSMSVFLGPAPRSSDCGLAHLGSIYAIGW
jgi:hypothetical protein